MLGAVFNGLDGEESSGQDHCRDGFGKGVIWGRRCDVTAGVTVGPTCQRAREKEKKGGGAWVGAGDDAGILLGWLARVGPS